jgi:hypothetical protein
MNHGAGITLVSSRKSVAFRSMVKGPNPCIRDPHTGFEPRPFQIRATGIRIEGGVCEHKSVLTFRMPSCGISEQWLFICVMLRFTKGKLNTDLGRFAGLRTTASVV